MRDKKSHVLDEVPCSRSADATLLRNDKGKPKVLIHDDTCFRIGSAATFGDASVEIIAQHHRTVQLEVIQGSLPTTNKLIQNFVVSTPTDIFTEFDRFWTPFWKRDTADEQFLDGTWSQLYTFIDSVPLPAIQEIELGLSDPQCWCAAVRDLKDGKACGIDLKDGKAFVRSLSRCFVLASPRL